MASSNNDKRPERDGKRWTEEEKTFVKRYYLTHSVSEIAKAIGRSETAVRAMAEKNNLKKAVKGQIVDGKKKCSVCGELLPLSQFDHSAKATNGYSSGCKFCYSSKQKEARKLANIKKATENEFYTCNLCGQTKEGWKFKWSSIKKRRESVCQDCWSNRDRKNKIKRIKEGRDW